MIHLKQEYNYTHTKNPAENEENGSEKQVNFYTKNN